jgi:uncharacterized membrane protein
MPQGRTVLRIGLGVLFLGATALQATHRETFAALVPKQLASHSREVQGVLTVVLGTLGASFLVPPLRLVARWGATALLVASLPAALDQTRHPEDLEALGLPPRAASLRIVAQIGVLAATWAATRKPD